MLDNEPVRIVIRPDSILKPALRHQAAFRHVALTDDHLPGIGTGLVGVGGKVAEDAVHPHRLVDVAGYKTVVIPLFGKIHIIVVGTLVGQLERTVDVVLDGVFLRGKPEGLEVVLTGRDPSQALLELADYATEMKKIKHPYDKGTGARKGVEF